MTALFSLFRRKKQRALGLDISNSSVKIVELSSNNGDVQIESFGVASLPPRAVTECTIREPEQVAAVIGQILEQTKPRTHRTIAAVSGTSVITRDLCMDATLSAAEIEHQILTDAERLLSFPAHEVAIDFEIQTHDASAPDKQNVLLVACRLETLESLQDTLKYANLIPEIVDIESHALMRAIHYQLPQRPIAPYKPIIAVADIGAALTTLNVLRGKEIIYSRDQRFGGRLLTEAIMRHFNLDYEEAEQAKISGNLPEEYRKKLLLPFIKAAIQHTNQGLQLFFSSSSCHRVDSLLLAGGCAATPYLAAALERYQAIPTRIANPFTQVSIGSAVNRKQLFAQAPVLITAFGLALRGLNHAKH